VANQTPPPVTPSSGGELQARYQPIFTDYRAIEDTTEMSSTEAQALRASIEALEGKQHDSKNRIMFHGLPAENYAEFKLAAELELMFEEDDKRKTRLLLSMLGIKPKSIIATNKPPRGTSLDEDWIWEKLDASYGDSARGDRAALELENLKLKGTSLPEFNQLFDVLTAQAGITGEAQARMYRNKMNQGIQDRLLVRGVTTLTQMKECASLFAPAAERDYKRALAQKGQKRNEKGRFQGTQTQPTKISCWNCNEAGHVVFKCQKPKDRARIERNKKRHQQDVEMTLEKSENVSDQASPTDGLIEECD